MRSGGWGYHTRIFAFNLRLYKTNLTCFCEPSEQRAGPPEEPRSHDRNSWLYMPLLHAAAGTQSSEVTAPVGFASFVW